MTQAQSHRGPLALTVTVTVTDSAAREPERLPRPGPTVSDRHGHYNVRVRANGGRLGLRVRYCHRAAGYSVTTRSRQLRLQV
jgi:hypothetical protein